MSERAMSFQFSTTAGSPAGQLAAAKVTYDASIDDNARLSVAVTGVPQVFMVLDADDLEEFGRKCTAFARSMRKAIEQSELKQDALDMEND